MRRAAHYNEKVGALYLAFPTSLSIDLALDQPKKMIYKPKNLISWSMTA